MTGRNHPDVGKRVKLTGIGAVRYGDEVGRTGTVRRVDVYDDGVIEYLVYFDAIEQPDDWREAQEWDYFIAEREAKIIEGGAS